MECYNTLYTSANDWADIQKRCRTVSPNSVLIQVFTGVIDQQHIEELLTKLRTDFPGTPIIGTSTAGEILSGESLDDKTLISFSVFEHSTVCSHITTQNDDLALAGRTIGQAIRQDHCKAVIVLGSGLKNGNTINGDLLLKAIHQQVGDAIISGGHAGDNGAGKSTFVFSEAEITENGVVAASIAGESLVASNVYNLSWVPIGKKFTITKASGSRVYTIDDKTPYEIYTHYLGQDVADNLPLSAADFPLIIERNGVTLAAHATGINDDGSFNYIYNFRAGEQLRFGFCHAGLLALSAQTTHNEIAQNHPQAIYVYSCVSRKWVLGQDISVELSTFDKQAPTAGFFSYGEYFYKDKKPLFFSQTMTVLMLRETPRDALPDQHDNPFTLAPAETRQFHSLKALHRLVDTSAREIEGINEKLAKLANRDSLTGLSNRRLFDEHLTHEIKNHSRAGLPLSIILMDVDFFKNYNDNYGHVRGDDCLRALSLVIQSVIKRPTDTAARYGGEEFGFILPMTDYEGASKLAEDLRNRIEALQIPHEHSTCAHSVTASFGVLTTTCSKNTTAVEVLDMCDQLLYKAKQQGRNTVCGMKN